MKQAETKGLITVETPADAPSDPAQDPQGRGGADGGEGGGSATRGIETGKLLVPEECFSEARLAAASGIHSRKVAKVREKMTEGADWEMRGTEIMLTPRGLTTLLCRLGLAIKKNAVTPLQPAEGIDLPALIARARVAPATAPDKATQKNAAPAPIEATVHRFYLNVRKMGVMLPGPERRIVAIFVAKRLNFTLGMKIPLLEARPGQWELASRLPRFPGRF